MRRKESFKSTVYRKHGQRCLDIVDHYGVPFHFRLDYGQREYSSYFGAFLTFMAFLSSMVFLYFKLVTWSQEPEIDLMFAIEENAFKMTD